MPGADEAIWLTDLEGHAAIYDNDSIRINYAEWFDRSQVHRVEVYRNGVKMDFLPDALEVLVNAEMKTFAGNPLEYSPQSIHSDHAIFGYQYEFVITLRDQTQVHATKEVRNPFTLRQQRSVNIGIAYDALEQRTDEELLQELRMLRDSGYQIVQFGVFYFAMSIDANEVVPIYDTASPHTEDWARTMREDEIRRLLRLIEDAGLSAEVRLELWLSSQYKAQYPHISGWDRSGLEPSDVEAWFRNYSDVLTELASIAEQEKAEVLCLGVELCSLNQHPDEWQQLARDLRAEFSGELTLSEATNLYIGLEEAGQSAFGKTGFEAMAGTFWDSLDYIEMNHWPFNLGGSTSLSQLDQRYTHLVNEFVEMWTPAVEHYELAYPQKRLMFGEIGTYIYDGVTIHGYQPDMFVSGSLALDHQEVSDVWASMLVGCIAMGLDGTAVWSMVLNPNISLNFTGSHYINIWPTSRLVQSFFPGYVPKEISVFEPFHVSGPDWSSLQTVFQFGRDARVSFYCSGDQPLSSAQYWGRSGCRVETVQVEVTPDSLLLGVNLHTGDQIGEYRYILCLNLNGNERVIVFLDPFFGAADIAYEHGDWIWLQATDEVMFVKTPTSVFASIPLEVFARCTEIDRLCESLLDFHIDYRSGGRRELFFFPGTSSLECGLTTSGSTETRPSEHPEGDGADTIHPPADVLPSSALGHFPQAIEVIGNLAYIADWSSEKLQAVSLDSGGVADLADGFRYVSDITSIDDNLLIASESGDAWLVDSTTGERMEYQVAATLAGEVLGIDYHDGVLYLLVQQSTGPAIIEIRSDVARTLPIAQGHVVEFVSLQMWGGRLLALDYLGNAVCELVLEQGSYTVEEFLHLPDVIDASEASSGEIRGMCFTDDAWYFTSVSFDGGQGRLHVVEPLE